MWWRTSNCSPLLIYRPSEDGRLSWPGWLTYSGRFTHISGHPSATGWAQDGERTLARDWRSTAEPRGLVYSIFEWHNSVTSSTAYNWPMWSQLSSLLISHRLVNVTWQRPPVIFLWRMLQAKCLATQHIFMQYYSFITPLNNSAKSSWKMVKTK